MTIAVGKLCPVRRIIGLLFFVTLFSGCALFSEISFYGDLLRANRAGVRFRRTHDRLELAVLFSGRSDVSLDVYSPSEGNGYPVLIFVHGGGWNSYNKELFAPVALELLPHGMVVVIPDYTLHPDATYRQMAREVADATAWVFANIERFGGDPERVFISGHSAGAHLSGLVAYDPSWLEETGHSPNSLAGWIGLSGVYDVSRHESERRALGLESPIMTAVMEGPPNFEAASPQSHVSGPGAHRAWLIHGALDETVPIVQSEAMRDALVQAGVRAELITYPEADHNDFLFGALGDPEARIIHDIGRIVRGEW